MVYTSRYGNPELSNERHVLLQISLGKPKFRLPYFLDGDVDELKPYESFRINDYDKFRDVYFKRLNKVGALKIKEKIESFYQSGKDIVLLCFEDVTKPDDWCHRTIFIEWWKEKTGQELKELSDPLTYEAQHQKKEEAEELKRRQISLLDMQL